MQSSRYSLGYQVGGAVRLRGGQRQKLERNSSAYVQRIPDTMEDIAYKINSTIVADKCYNKMVVRTLRNPPLVAIFDGSQIYASFGNLHV